MRVHTLLIAMMVFAAASPTRAQDTYPAHKWSHCATLTGSGGVASASDDAGAMFGGAIGWEITPRVGLEGSVTWFDKPTGSSAFAAGLSVRSVLAASSWLSPFVEGGFGMYSVSFDPRTATDIPSFYRNRMTGGMTDTFTDPAFFAGAGVDVMRRNNLAVRPTAGAIIAVQDGETHAVGTFVVRVEYHFGGLPLAPSRHR
jgi:outer membrane protein with beta-barrel domain